MTADGPSWYTKALVSKSDRPDAGAEPTGPDHGGTVMIDAPPREPALGEPALGGTVLVGADERSDEGAGEGLGGTVLTSDDAPRVAGDGTILVGADDLPEAAADADARPSSAPPIPSRSSKPPPLPAAHGAPRADDTSIPPELAPTPAPPQTGDYTVDRSHVGGETADVSPAPTAAAAAPPQTASAPAAAPAPRAAVSPGKATAEPAPRPPKVAAKLPTQPAPAPPPRQKFPLWAQLLALVVVAGGIGHLVARSQNAPVAPTSQPVTQPPPKPAAQPTADKPREPAQPAPVPDPPVPAEPSASASGAAPAPDTPGPAPVAAADLSACVAAEIQLTLPTDGLKFVCEEPDANRAQRTMSTLLATAKNLDHDARGAFNKLGWYRMAKLQVVRTRCCGDVAPLGITEALAACGLGESLRAIHEAVRTRASIEESANAYKKAVDCLFKQNTMRMFGIISRPGEYEHDAFVSAFKP